MRSFFGDMFDFNHDGELDTFERAMELEEEVAIADSECPIYFWEELGRETENADDEDETELEMSGLDPLELEFMDSDERERF